MKRVLAFTLCLAMVAGMFAGCAAGEKDPSVLQTFSQMLTTSGYTYVTTTGPDGTTTVELVPPDATTTQPTQTLPPVSGTTRPSGTTQQSTTVPSGVATTQPSAKPSTQSTVTTKPDAPTSDTTAKPTTDKTTAATTDKTTGTTGATTAPSVSTVTDATTAQTTVTTQPTVAPTTEQTTAATTTQSTVVPTTEQTTAATTTQSTMTPTTAATTTQQTVAPTTAATTTQQTVAPTTAATTTQQTVAPTTAATTAQPTVAPTTMPTTVTTQVTATPTTAPTTAVPTTVAPTTTQPTTGTTGATNTTVTVPQVTTEPEVLKLTKTNLVLMDIGHTFNLSDGKIDPAKVTWVSQDEEVVTVKNGIVTAKKMGSTKVYAFYKDQAAYCTVTVQIPTTEPPPVLKLTYTKLTLLVGHSQTLYRGDIPIREIIWQVEDPAIAVVENGTVFANKAGSTVIRASWKGQTAQCRLTVQNPTTDPTTDPPTYPPTTDPTTLPPTGTTKPSTTVSPSAHDKISYTGRYLYKRLGTQEQEWYRAIDKAVNNLENGVTLSGDFSVDGWHNIYFYYMFDNPEHFYLGARVSYSSSGKLFFSYSDGTTNSYASGSVNEITETMRQNIRARKSAFEAEVNRIISAVPVDIPDVEKELMLYDRLLIDMYYNDDAIYNSLWDGVAEPNWSAYGAIINKRGVCEAYSEAFQTLCYAVGINCIGVVGVANGGGHKWNAVYIGGDWYQCDVTFDDPVGGAHGVAEFHNYFNITSAQIKAKGHSIAGSDYPGPNCTATKYSYKNYFG